MGQITDSLGGGFEITPQTDTSNMTIPTLIMSSKQSHALSVRSIVPMYDKKLKNNNLCLTRFPLLNTIGNKTSREIGIGIAVIAVLLVIVVVVVSVEVSGSRRSGVNFTNILRAAFMRRADP